MDKDPFSELLQLLVHRTDAKEVLISFEDTLYRQEPFWIFVDEPQWLLKTSENKFQASDGGYNRSLYSAVLHGFDY